MQNLLFQLLHLYIFHSLLQYRMKRTIIFLIFLTLIFLLLLLLHPNQNQFSPDVVIVPETHQVNGGRSDTHLHKLMTLMMMN